MVYIGLISTTVGEQGGGGSGVAPPPPTSGHAPAEDFHVLGLLSRLWFRA